MNSKIMQAIGEENYILIPSLMSKIFQNEIDEKEKGFLISIATTFMFNILYVYSIIGENVGNKEEMLRDELEERIVFSLDKFFSPPYIISEKMSFYFFSKIKRNLNAKLELTEKEKPIFARIKENLSIAIGEIGEKEEIKGYQWKKEIEEQRNILIKNHILS